MKKKSVAILGTRGYPSHYGGFETAVRHLGPYLADHGWDVTIYCRHGQDLSSDHADPRIHRVFTRGIDTRSLSSLSYSFSSMFDAAKRKPSVALVMNVANGFALPLLKFSRTPVLLNVDGIEWERDKWNRFAKSVFRLAARASARLADRLVFDAFEIGKYWEREFSRDGVFIPYGGTNEFNRRALPDGLTHRGYAMMVARFVPENSVAEFFAAVPQIAAKYPVVIVGSSGYGGELDAAAKKLSSLPNVIWLGHLRDDDLLHSLWSSSGAYFHGHSVGGTNPALVQAMTLGAPVVARDTSFNREVLGGAGRFVSHTPAEIADGLLGVLGDSQVQDSMSRRAVERANAVYTWEKVCAAYEEELTRLVRGGTS